MANADNDQTELIEACLIQIRFSGDNGFIIGSFIDTYGNQFVSMGNMINPQIEMTYMLSGRYENNPKYGEQFKFFSYETVMPNDCNGIFKYIVRVCKFVGSSVGNAIIDKYGKETLSVMKNDPEKISNEISGLTIDRAKEIRATLLNNEKDEKIMIELESILDVPGMLKRVHSELMTKYKNEAAEIVKFNPYILTSFRGVGFPLADRVALKNGTPRDDIERKKAAIVFCIFKYINETGSTWIPSDEFNVKIKELIQVPKIQQGIDALFEEGFLVESEIGYSVSDFLNDELLIAKKIVSFVNSENLVLKSDSHCQKTGLIEYTEQQLSAIEKLKLNNILLLIGGPGTGKTTTTLAIIEWAESSSLRIIQAAPTGKASKRMIEATNRQSSTIHTMLGCVYDEHNGFEFIHNANNPLNCDLLIIDEVSMITNELMARVIEAIDATKTKLLLIGDPNQLPSVGPGAVLRDLLSSKIVPMVELTVIHRNSGDIVNDCHSIKYGKSYIPKKKIDLESDNPHNLIHVELSNVDKIMNAVKKIVCERMPLRGYDPIGDVQIISPVNSKGPLSCDSINQIIQGELNPSVKVANKDKEDFLSCFDEPNPFEKIEELEKQNEKKEGPIKREFRVGDKVINIQNSRAIKTDGSESAIVNGDIGIIQRIDNKKMVVLFADPEREIQLSKSDKSIKHAYCITCHKFQGSEAAVIIIPVHKQFNYFLTNSWIYTAISRGKDIVITIGQFSTIEKAIKNRKPNNRYTMLTKKIVSLYGEVIEKEFEGI